MEMGEKKLMSTSHGFNKKRLSKPNGDSTTHSHNRGSLRSSVDEAGKALNEDVSYLKTGGIGADQAERGEMSKTQRRSDD